MIFGFNPETERTSDGAYEIMANRLNAISEAVRWIEQVVPGEAETFPDTLAKEDKLTAILNAEVSQSESSVQPMTVANEGVSSLDDYRRYIDNLHRDADGGHGLGRAA